MSQMIRSRAPIDSSLSESRGKSLSTHVKLCILTIMVSLRTLLGGES